MSCQLNFWYFYQRCARVFDPRGVRGVLAYDRRFFPRGGSGGFFYDEIRKNPVFALFLLN